MTRMRRPSSTLDRASERVALRHVAGLKPVVNHFWRCCEEPCVHVVGIDLALGLLLDAVVADGRRGVQGVVDLRPA